MIHQEQRQASAAPGSPAERVSTKARLARLARRVLPGTSVTLNHLEPGLKLEVNLKRNVMFWSQGLAAFEPESVAVLMAVVEPGDVVFDIGANVGFYTTLLSRWTGPNGKVVAFEPDAGNLNLLRRNVTLNKCTNVEVHAAAVGATSGHADFSLDEATGATGHLGNGLTQGESTVGRGRINVVLTRVETVDDISSTLQLCPTLIKLDIEGSECEALRGAVGVLNACRPIVLSELNGVGGQEVLQILTDANYLLWDVETGRPIEQGDARPFMVVALPVEGRDSERGRRLVSVLPKQKV